MKYFREYALSFLPSFPVCKMRRCFLYLFSLTYKLSVCEPLHLKQGLDFCPEHFNTVQHVLTEMNEMIVQLL